MNEFGTAARYVHVNCLVSADHKIDGISSKLVKATVGLAVQDWWLPYTICQNMCSKRALLKFVDWGWMLSFGTRQN